jgi:hypothetical protein
MKVRCKIVDSRKLGPDERKNLDTFFNKSEDRRDLSNELTLEQEYLVYGLEWRYGYPCVYVTLYPDYSYPRIFPLYLFDIVDRRIPQGWQVFDEGINSDSIFLTYPKLGDYMFYSNLVDGEEEEEKEFQKIRAQLEAEYKSEDDFDE